MKMRFYKELWRIRFDKMLALEEQSAVDYEELLAETGKNYPGHAIIPYFQKLIADEKRHALLVKELIEILERQTI